MDTEAIQVYIARVNVLEVDLGFDISGDTITSEIRTESGTLIATWAVTFESTGSDGKLVLTMDDFVSAPIAYERGLMDLKRVSAGQPYPVFTAPLEVEFVKPVTA